MNIDELIAEDPSIAIYIEKFVGHPLFLAVKDAFVSHAPIGNDNEESSLACNHGKYLGTRHVFNRLEEISRQTKRKQVEKKTGKSGERDPDMEA